MHNPYLNSGKRDSDVQATEWPMITRGTLADFMAIESHYGADEINQPVFALVRARKAINDAKLACNGARKHWKANRNVMDRLESLIGDLELVAKRFPLDVR